MIGNRTVALPRVRNNLISASRSYRYSQEEKFFLFYYPLINILFYSFIDLIPEEYNFDILRGLFSFIIISYFFMNWGLILDKAGKILLVFTVYISIMSLVTYFKFGYLDKVVFKIIIASSFYYMAFAYIKDFKHFVLLLKSFYYGLILVLLSMVFTNLFNIGPSQIYGIDANLGAQGANTTKILPILFFPLLVQVINFQMTSRKKNLYYLVIVVSIVVILFGTKRGAVFGTSLALIIYLIFSGRKGKTVRMLIPLVILLLIFLALFWQRIEEAYIVRSERYQITNQETIEEEARYWETITTLQNISLNSPVTSIFGFGFKSEFFIYKTRRMFHTDYMTLLHGTGILGLLLYLWFYYLIYRKNKKKIPSTHKYYQLIKDVQAISIALIVYLLIIGISGAIHSIELRAFSLFFWGGSIRLQYFLLKQKKTPVYHKSPYENFING